MGGLILANMGVIGLYLGKVFNEVKERPLYIVSETINIEQSGVTARASAGVF
jgi:dolichol-phosphate mannosyltransferase